MQYLVLIFVLTFVDLSTAQGPRKCGNLTTPAMSTTPAATTGVYLFRAPVKLQFERNQRKKTCELCLKLNTDLKKYTEQVCKNEEVLSARMSLLPYVKSCESMRNYTSFIQEHFKNLCTGILSAKKKILEK